MPELIPTDIRDDVATLWAYHQMGHQVRPGRRRHRARLPRPQRRNLRR
jgi:hypothetical protein